MLLSMDDLVPAYAKYKGKLETLMRLRTEAPPEFRVATDHFASMSWVFPYLYHTALVERTLAKTATASPRILDWGAFLGQVTYLLQDRFDIDAYNPGRDALIDYWHQKLEVSRRFFADKNDLSTGKISCASGSYDAVICSGVLEHTFEFGVQDLDALKEIHRVLRDDGHLFIWHLPCKNSREERRAQKPGVWRHILSYELDDILVKLSLAGFEVVGVEKTGLAFGTLLSALGWLLGVPRVWALDLWLSRSRWLGPEAHDFTIVCRKPAGFPEKPIAMNYTVFVP
jgi:SAM-dependent methyltransferase